MFCYTTLHYFFLLCEPVYQQIVDSMHLSKVDMVFRLLSLNQAYVTNSGRLVGVVTRSLLRDYLGMCSPILLMLLYAVVGYYSAFRYVLCVLCGLCMK